MTAAYALLRAHWPLALALLLGVAIGWALCHSRQPAVHEKADTHASESEQGQKDTREDVGGWTRTTYDFAPATGEPGTSPCRFTSGVAPAAAHTGQPLTSVIVERHDPTVITSHSTEQVQAQQDQHLDLTVAPEAQPGWALQVGIEGMQARAVRLAARRRIVGPIWLELSAVPVQRSLGAAVAVEW